MQQRQLRLGDTLDDYCPRERRLTNHAIVAMVGPDVKQTRCTTCDTEHEYKHAKVPRQRRKSDTPAALYSQVLAGGPKRIAHEPPRAVEPADTVSASSASNESLAEPMAPAKPGKPGKPAKPGKPGKNEDDVVAIDKVLEADSNAPVPERDADERDNDEREGGPVHRPLIRASLPRPQGQPPPMRPPPEFTIRQPGGRQDRFRPRHTRGGQQFQTNRSPGYMGGGPPRGGMPRQGGGRPPHGPMTSRPARHQGPGRKRSK